MLSSRTVIIECPSCRSKYQYDEERFERKPSKKIKCAKCAQIFEIHNPAFAGSAPPKVDAGESTNLRRDQKPKSKEPEATAQSPLPTSTDQQPLTAKLPAGKRLSLAIIDGPDAGSVFRIDKPRVTIGRSGADLTLNDSEASRQHAAVEIRDTVYTLHDLNSTNGTLVNGERIRDVVELTNHSEFVVGSSTLMLIVTDDV